MTEIRQEKSGTPVSVANQRTLTRTSQVSMAMVAVVIVLWQTPFLRGQDILTIGFIGILCGIPHGAVDFLLPLSGPRPRRVAGLVMLFGLYIAGAVIGLLLIFLAPIVVYLGVLALAVFHWGGGDASYRRARDGVRATYGDIVEMIAYGAPVIFFGAALWPDEVRRILAGVADGVVDETQTAFEYVAWATLAAMVVFSIRTILARKWTEVVEMLLLGALGAFVPPAVAFGFYFACWHSLRNTVRLLVDARVPAAAVPRADLAHVGARRLAWTMAIGTVGSLIFALGVVAIATTVHNGAGFAVGNWAVVILSAVVAPHVVTVLRYDLWKLRTRPSV